MHTPTLKAYAAAGYPAVAVETCEEERLTAAILAELPDHTVWMVSAVGGLRDARTGEALDAAGYSGAFAAAAGRDAIALVVLDYHHLAKNAGQYRPLRDAMPALRSRGSLAILIAPAWSLPAELAHEVPVIQWALPTRAELRAALDVCSESAGVPVDDGTARACLDAAAGLTLSEAEGAFALALATVGQFDRALIEREKLRLIRGTGYLEVAPPADPATVGGLGALREYLAAELVPAADDSELRVRGVILVGVPGTGKSLAAKATGAMLGWPVVRLDLSGCKGSLVGESERNLRHALALVDAVAPAVLWLDEIEKAVGGYQSSAATDSGVTLGMVGGLLTWMQEHRTAVTVVATCNDYSKLPAELTRAGRFDERFFVDLPTAGERVDIAAVHLARYNAGADMPATVAGMTEGWTGAEIEQLIRSAARRTARKLTADALRDCARDIKPLSKVRAAEIKALRDWARDTLRLANTPEAAPPTTARRVQVAR